MADFSPAEATQLVDAFKALDVKPKTDTPEELKAWMLSYLTTQGEVPKSDTGAKILSSFPRIATLCGHYEMCILYVLHYVLMSGRHFPKGGCV